VSVDAIFEASQWHQLTAASLVCFASSVSMHFYSAEEFQHLHCYGTFNLWHERSDQWSL